MYCVIFVEMLLLWLYVIECVTHIWATFQASNPHFSGLPCLLGSNAVLPPMDQWLHLSTIGFLLQALTWWNPVTARGEMDFLPQRCSPSPDWWHPEKHRNSTCLFVAAFAAAAKKWEQHVHVTSTSQGSGYVHGSGVVSRHTWYTTSQATKPQNGRLSAENSAPGLPSFGPWSCQPTETKNRITKFQKVREQVMLFVFIVIYHIDIRIYSVILSDLCMLVFLIYTSLSIDFVSSPLSSSWEPKAACTQGSWHGVIRIFWELTISPVHNFKQRKQAGFFLHKLVETFF